MTSESDNPFEPQGEPPKDQPKVRPKQKLAVRRSRWVDAGTRDYVRPTPGFTREFGNR